MPKYCPDCGLPMTGIQYAYDSPDHYDGVSEWMCQGCGCRLADGAANACTGMT